MARALSAGTWFTTHPRYHLFFPPTGASRLNLGGRRFAEITRKRVGRGAVREIRTQSRHLRISLYLRKNNRQPLSVHPDGHRFLDHE